MAILLTLLRLHGVGKELRYLDVLITCALVVTLFGCKLDVDDVAGFLIVAFVAFLTMTTGGVWAALSGGVVLIPCVLQVYERWRCQKGYWFESLLGFCILMMLIFTLLPDSDASELTFLIFSFLSKAMIVAFVTLD